jgi:hypothetical protein
MIQRFCFVKLREPEIAARGALAEKLSAELRSAGADAVVGLPADASAVRWDLSLVITAASLEAWHALSRLPAITAAFDDLAQRAAVVKAWTFEAVAD